MTYKCLEPKIGTLLKSRAILYAVCIPVEFVPYLQKARITGGVPKVDFELYAWDVTVELTIYDVIAVETEGVRLDAIVDADSRYVLGNKLEVQPHREVSKRSPLLNFFSLVVAMTYPLFAK